MELFASAYGVPFGLETTNTALFERALAHLPPAWTRSAPTPGATAYRLAIEAGPTGLKPVYSLDIDGTWRSRHEDLDAMLEEFESALQLHIAEMAPDRVFIHAGVVVWRGRAIVLPGQSFSGKTTLVAELIKRGAGYFSDEYAVFDASGSVYAYPRRLSVRRAGHAGPGRDRVTAAPAPTDAAVTTGGVLLCQYRPDAIWSPEPLTPGEGALALLSHAVAARRSPQRVLAAISALVSSAPVYRSDRAEAAPTAELILRSCDATL